MKGLCTVTDPTRAWTLHPGLGFFLLGHDAFIWTNERIIQSDFRELKSTDTVMCLDKSAQTHSPCYASDFFHHIGDSTYSQTFTWGYFGFLKNGLISASRMGGKLRCMESPWEESADCCTHLSGSAIAGERGGFTLAPLTG